MPGSGLFIRVGDLKDAGFPPVRSDDLQADGQTCFGESAGNRNRGHSPNIDRASVSQQQEFPRAQKIGILFQFGNRRRCDRRRGRHQYIYIGKNRHDVASRAFQFASRFKQGLKKIG